MTDHEEQFQTLHKQTLRKNRLEVLLEELRYQKTELEHKLVRLSAEKQSEQTDVDRLEGRSLAALFYGIVGKKEEKLDKERREAHAAEVRYDAAVREMEAVKEDIRCYEAELLTLSGCVERFAEAFREKAERSRSSGTSEADRMLHLEKTVAGLEQREQEIEEAVSAGTVAKSTAETILSHLEDAEGWGTWDLFGGGLISDLAKHSSLDAAQEMVEQLQVELRRFKTELADVTVPDDMQVNVDGFLRFADCFFDGLIADWTVLDHISESLEQVEKTKKQIDGVLEKLSSMQSAAEKERTQAKAELDELIVKTSL